MKKSITMKPNLIALKALLVMFLCIPQISKAVGNNCIPPPNCQISGPSTICFGGSIQLCAPAGLNSYSWSHVNAVSPEGLPNTQCITITEGGTYTVFVTDFNQCSNSCTWVVTEVPPPTCEINGNFEICPGDFGTLCATSQQNAYLWSTGETTECIDVTSANIFVVTITDVNGCTCSIDQEATLLNGPSVDAGEDFAMDCSQQTAELSATGSSGGKSGIDYSWTTNDGNMISGEDSPNLTIGSPGTYIVIVTDQESGCSATDEVVVSGGTSGCKICSGSTIYINTNVTINFNNNPPTYSGDPDLLPYFNYDNSGLTPDLWKVSFKINDNKLVIKNGATISTKRVNGYAPGIEIIGDCDFEMEKKSRIIVESDKKDGGDILLQFRGDIIINGEVRAEITGVKGGLPGNITVATQCGNIGQGTTGIIQTIGEDNGGSNISLLSCGCGNINLIGLTMAYGEGTIGDPNLNRPSVRVIAYSGGINIVANSTEPLYDEYSMHGVKYDLWGGVLAWTDKNTKTGTVEIQAQNDISVVGHGTDPTGSVRRSFGAVAAVATGSNSLGGIVDVRSLDGKITAENRAFDVSGKNRLFPNIAKIKLHASGDISLIRSGSNNNFNPILDARSPVSGGRGGTNDIRSYAGRISIGYNARVLASVPSGGGSIQGVNLLEACTGTLNLGTVTPADLIPGNNAGSCAHGPTTKVETCWNFNQVEVESKLASTDLLSNKELRLYPNPSDGNVTLQFNSSKTGLYNVQVVSVTGVVVLTKSIDASEGINMNELDLSNVAKGMYVVILNGDDLKLQKRITIQ